MPKLKEIDKETKMVLEELEEKVSNIVDKAQAMDSLEHNYFFQKFIVNMMASYVELLALIDPQNVLGAKS